MNPSVKIFSGTGSQDLALKIGTSQPAIARLESGNYRNLSLAFINKLAKALDAEPVIHLKSKNA